MKTHQHRVVGSGLFALDVVVHADGQTSPPTLGGSAGNVLGILGALGWQATPVATLGDDPAGEVIHQDFARIGSDLRFMRKSSKRSTPVIYQHQLQTTHGSTHRFSFACPTCGVRRRPVWDDEAFFTTDDPSLPDAGVFFLDRPTRLGVVLAEHYSLNGAVVVFEPSAVGDDPELFARAVRCADIIKYADDRIEALADFDLGSVSVEIQTHGADGLRFRAPSAGGAWFNLSAYKLPRVRDTAGAGDWCTAGMIFDLFYRKAVGKRSIDRETIATSLSFGQALATLNCMTEGARGLLATWSPDKIVKAARELSALRLHAISDERSRMAAPISEPRLEALADEVGFDSSAEPSGFDVFRCCPTF